MKSFRTATLYVALGSVFPQPDPNQYIIKDSIPLISPWWAHISESHRQIDDIHPELKLNFTKWPHVHNRSVSSILMDN